MLKFNCFKKYEVQPHKTLKHHFNNCRCGEMADAQDSKSVAFPESILGRAEMAEWQTHKTQNLA